MTKREKPLVADPFKEWGERNREKTKRELARYIKEDWAETIGCLLGGCPERVEVAIHMISLELRTDPANENLTMATKYLTWVLQDVMRAQTIAECRL